MNEIFLDTETTGLSFKEGHKIVEIACIETKELIPTGNVFHKLINPLRSVPDEAYKIHGFSEKFLSNKETFDKIADDFLSFIKGKKIIIHNANFDLGFINGELNLIKKELIEEKFVVDSLDLARNKFPGASNSLDALCKKYRIDNSKRKNHSALIDCDLLTKVYINLVDQREPTLDFKANNENKTEKINVQKSYFKKIVYPSNEEIKLHGEYLKNKIKRNFFS